MLLVPHGGEEGIVNISMRVVVLQRAILEVPHYRVHAGQILEAFLNVSPLPDLLVKVVRLVYGVGVLGVHSDAFGTALAGDALAVLLLVVGLVLRLFPFYVVLLRGDEQLINYRCYAIIEMGA